MSIPTEYDVGDVAVLWFGFTNRPLTPAERETFEEQHTLPAGAGVAPASVVCNVRKADGTTVAPPPAVSPIVNGVCSAQVTIDNVPGTWWYSADGDGGFKASGERSFKVKKRRVPR